jgi:hypothetical protein
MPNASDDIRKAEEEARKVFDVDLNFASGFGANDYELTSLSGVNPWLTERGLTGLATATYLSDEEDKEKWFIKREAVRVGEGQLDRQLEAFKALGQTRNFYEDEAAQIREIQARKALVNRDLAYVYKNKGGDLDAPIDTDGKSFNERFGAEEPDLDVLSIVEGIIDNPSYMAGTLTSMLIADLPLLGIGVLASSSKLAKGSMLAKAINRVNGVQSRLLRGLGKASIGASFGAIGGAAWEGSYEYLNENKITVKSLETGGMFGAVFGGGIGLLAGTLGKPTAQTRRGGKKKTVDKPSLETRQALIEEIFDEGELNDISKFSEQIINDPYELFGNQENIAGGSIVIVSHLDPKVKKAKADPRVNKLEPFDETAPYDIYELKDQKGRPEKTRYLISMDDSRLQKGYKNTASKLTQSIKDGISSLTYREARWLANEKANHAAKLIEAKIDIQQHRDGSRASAKANSKQTVEQVKEQMFRSQVTEEMDRLEQVWALESADKGAVHAGHTARNIDDEIDSQATDTFKRETADTTVRGDASDVPSYARRATNILSKHPKKSMAVGGVIGLSIGDKEDKFHTAVGGALAAGAAPLVYKYLSAPRVAQTLKKARLVTAAKSEQVAILANEFDLITQALSDDIEKLVPVNSFGVFLDAIERPNHKPAIKFKDKAINDLVNRWRIVHDELYRVGIDAGMWKPDDKLGAGLYLHNYAAHLIRGKFVDGVSTKLNLNEMDELIKDLSKHYNRVKSINSARELQRDLRLSIGELAEKYDIVTNPAQILSIYSQSMIRTVANRQLLNGLEKFDIMPNVPALIKADKFDDFLNYKLHKEGAGSKEDKRKMYSTLDHGSLEGYLVHTDLKPVLQGHFAVKADGTIGGTMEIALKVSNALKRIAVFGSLFHANALSASMMYVMGISGLLKGVVGRGKMFQELKLGTESFRNHVLAASREGLGVGNVKRKSLVNMGKSEIDEVLENISKIRGLGYPTKFIKGTADHIDTITWEYLHDRFKIASWLHQKERIFNNITKNKSYSDKELVYLERRAGEEAAVFIDDAFGSLNWNKFATWLQDYAYRHPDRLRGKMADIGAVVLTERNRRWLNLGIFAPDWTAANIRIVGKAFGLGGKLTKRKVERILKGDWKTKEDWELVEGFKMYAGYTTKAGAYTSGMYWMAQSMFGDEKPTMDGLHEFWFGEGHGRVDLGNGHSVTLSKQIFEPIDWIYDPAHTLSNKGAGIPKTAMELFYNKQWMSLKEKGAILGPPIWEEDGGSHFTTHMLGKLVPIGYKPLVFSNGDTWNGRLRKTAFGLAGFPIYGKLEEKNK